MQQYNYPNTSYIVINRLYSHHFPFILLTKDRNVRVNWHPLFILQGDLILTHFCNTEISLCSDSSLPCNAFLSITFTATYVPLCNLSSANMTFEKAPLKNKHLDIYYFDKYLCKINNSSCFISVVE